MENKKITIFTPTYNRAYIIEKLYYSLKNQINKNFEWLVIDDGSNDDTELLFQKIQKDNNDFKIRYIKKENGGKHRAINLGVELAEGELFFIVDSDDVLTNDAVEKIIEWEETIKDKSKFAGVSGNKGYEENKLIGKTFLGEFIDATSLEREKYKILGDKAEVFYTKILKKFKFPEYEGENFITENVVWYEIAAKGYKIRWFNEIIYIADYLEDGLTKSGNKIFVKNPKGYGKSIQIYIKYLNKGLKYSLSKYYNYYKELKENLTLFEIKENLNTIMPKLYLAIILGNINKILKGLKNEIK